MQMMMAGPKALDPKRVEAALQLLKRGRYQMLKPHPHVSYGACKLEFVADPACSTLYTNGQVIGYNPEYVLTTEGPNGTPPNFQYAVSEVAHETWHALLSHCKDWAAQGLNPKRVNAAQDYAVNLLVKDMGLPIHPTWLCDEKYRGMHWREIYDALPKEKFPESDCIVMVQPPPGGFGGGDADPDQKPDPNGAKDTVILKPSTPQSGTDAGPQGPAPRPGEKFNDWGKIVVEAAKFADSMGSCPGFMKDMVESITKPVIDYKTVLARYLSKVKRDSYSFRRPNKRYLDMIFPTLSGYTADALIYTDTSGSMWSILNRIWGEVEGVVRAVGIPVDIMMGDTTMAAVKTLRRPGDVKLLQKSGGGGTDFAFVFDFIAKGYTVDDPGAKGSKKVRRVHKPEVLLFFTDGEGSYPTKRPPYPVVWFIPGAEKLKGGPYWPPFGKVVSLPF